MHTSFALIYVNFDTFSFDILQMLSLKINKTNYDKNDQN